MGSWEVVNNNEGHGDRVRRLRVPGGWLYQVERVDETEGNHQDRSWTCGWHPPVFVPEVESIDAALAEAEKELGGG